MRTRKYLPGVDRDILLITLLFVGFFSLFGVIVVFLLPEFFCFIEE
jgi:hypothetical protein